jgi:hypothetical protein
MPDFTQLEKYDRAFAKKKALDDEHARLRERLKELIPLRNAARVNLVRRWNALSADERFAIEMGFDEPDEPPAEVTPSDQHILADVPASPFDNQ